MKTVYDESTPFVKEAAAFGIFAFILVMVFADSTEQKAKAKSEA